MWSQTNVGNPTSIKTAWNSGDFQRSRFYSCYITLWFNKGAKLFKVFKIGKGERNIPRNSWWGFWYEVSWNPLYLIIWKWFKGGLAFELAGLASLKKVDS